MTSTSLSALPETIDGYRVEGLLGRGASGLVLRVHDDTLDRSLALKLLADDVDDEAKRRFLIEARAAARIAHPNVVQVYSVGEHLGRAYITQELVDGYPLSSLLEVRGALSASAVIDIGIQVAEGLASAAEVGVLHRDVKPQNLLVTDQGTVKLADFGVAKLLDAPTAMTDDGTTVGTPHYMSPEQGQGRALDARADQYSLGATLYHLLAGRPPFDADNVLSLLLKHVQDPLEPLSTAAPECPTALAIVVERMLAKSADARYAGFAEVAAALAEAQGSFAEKPGPEVLALVEAAAKEGKPRLPTEVMPAASPRAVTSSPWTERALLLAGIAAAIGVFLATQIDRGPSRQVTRASIVEPAPPPTPEVVTPPPPPAPEPPVITLPKKRPRGSDPVGDWIKDLDRDPATAMKAAAELAKRGDQAATMPLLRALERGPSKVAVAAATALGELGDIRALDGLKAASENAKSSEVRAAASAAHKKLWHVEGE